MNKDAPLKALLIIFAFAIMIATLIDLACAWVLPIGLGWPFYTYFTAFWLLLLSPVLARRFSKRKLMVILVFISAMGILYFIPWSTRKPFLRDLYSIRPGMTISEVENIMSGYMKGSGLSWPPIWDDQPKSFASVSSSETRSVIKGEDGQMEIRDSMAYRHSNDGNFNADWGLVTFKDGKVEGVEFLPD